MSKGRLMVPKLIWISPRQSAGRSHKRSLFSFSASEGDLAFQEAFLQRWKWNIQGVQECSIPENAKFLRIFITIKTIEFGILISLSDRAVLLAFWRILNQGNRPNKTENTWHYVKRVTFLHPNWSGKRRFYELFNLTHGMIFLFICGCVLCLFWVKTNLKSYKWLKLHVWDCV